MTALGAPLLVAKVNGKSKNLYVTVWEAYNKQPGQSGLTSVH